MCCDYSILPEIVLLKSEVVEPGAVMEAAVGHQILVDAFAGLENAMARWIAAG